MALTPFRWTVALLLLMAATLALVSPPEESERTRVFRWSTPEVSAHTRTWQQLNRAKARLALALLRDSVVLLADGPADDALLLRTGEDLPQSMVQYLSARIRRQQAAGRGVSHPVMPVAFVAITDFTSRGYWLGNGISLILPSDRSPHCIALLRVRPGMSDLIAEGMAVEAALQPPSFRVRQPLGLSGCAWYALFGRPGSTVGRWLAATGYAYAAAVPGDTSAGEFAPAAPIYSLRLHGVGIKGLACSAGNGEACKQVLTGRAVQRFFYPSWRLSDDMIAVQPVPGGFGPAQFHLLADMVADIGPEAFQRFWSSSRPIEEAFREATGAELLEWTEAWARRYVGPVQGGPMPALATAGVVSLLVIVGLVVGAGLRGRGAAGQ